MADFQNRRIANADSVSTLYSRGRGLNGESSESLVGGDELPGEQVASSSVIVERGNWDAFSSMDQITVVRIDDCHIAELQAQWGKEEKAKGENTECLEVEYSLPTDEDSINFTGAEMTIGEPLRETEDEEDGVYVIEYSNPEEEGESYRFKLAVDGQLSTKEQLKHPKGKRDIKHTSTGKRRVTEGSKVGAKSNRKTDVKFCCPVCAATFPSKETLLHHEAKHGDTGGESADRDGKRLVCTLCPPPGKLFKKMAGLSVHLKFIHYKEKKKDHFCGVCRKLCRNQLDLDAHIRRHAKQMAVYQCSLCPFKSDDKLSSGFSARYVMKNHLESEHSGIIPSCHICNRNFKNLTSYLSDQFRHVGVSPFYCPKCKIYEMTERGLIVHLRNDKLKKRAKEGVGEEDEVQEEEEYASIAENSATDDSDS